MSKTKKFMDFLEEEEMLLNNITLTENGALVYKSTLSPLVDFNASTTSLRGMKDDTIHCYAKRAYAEDPVKFVKLLFNTGDIRGGKGERRIFNACMDWLAANHPAVACEVLPLIPEYTRWDYLVRLSVSANPQVSKLATELVVTQLLADKEVCDNTKEGYADISLLAKWMPSVQTKKDDQKVIVKHFLKKLNMKEKEYRKLLSMLRDNLNIIEKHMSAKDYDRINLENLTSMQQLRYNKFFSRVMAEKRHAYIQDVLAGRKSMNTEVLNPTDVCRMYKEDSRLSKVVQFSEDYEALWSLLPDRTSGNGNTLVVRDGSGSMLSRVSYDSKVTSMDVADALTIYCAEKLTGQYKNKFITFSARPRFVDMSECKTLADKLNLLRDYDEISNTNIEATFDLILETAVDNKLTQKDLPSYVLILSDMEFDCATGNYCGNSDGLKRKTLFDTIRTKWEEAGYKLPTLVFWNLSVSRTLYPTIDEDNGVVFLSGYSTNDLSLVMAGEFESIEFDLVDISDENSEDGLSAIDYDEDDDFGIEVKRVVLTPQEQLDKKLSQERYDAVEEAARRGLLKESA